MDAIALLKKDHREVEQLFKKFQAAGERAGKQKLKLVQQMIAELSKHAVIEESLFYPACRAALKEIDDEDQVLESLEEHHVVKWLLSELDGMKPSEERFDAKVSVLIENVKHHVKEEERELFPKVKRLLAKEHLQALGVAMAELKKSAPTKPHPRSPDQPPGNLFTTPIAAITDRATDLVKGAMRRRRGREPVEHTTH